MGPSIGGKERGEDRTGSGRESGETGPHASSSSILSARSAGSAKPRMPHRAGHGAWPATRVPMRSSEFTRIPSSPRALG